MISPRNMSAARSIGPALLLALSACGGGNTPKPVTPAKVAVPANPIDRAVALLVQGDSVGALGVLQPLLQREPANPEAKLLVASIQQDPLELLGPKSFPYKSEPGDTMLSLAEKFLGNRLKFYQLSRYNGLKVPAQLAAGTTLKIPGEAPRAAVPEAPPAALRTSSGRGAARNKPQQGAPAAAPRAPVADPAAAMRLRGAALTALSQGRADQAVAMLRRAAALAPGNPLVARDLARAERVAQTVRAHH